MPPFGLEGGVPLALARGAWVAALLSSFGIFVFWLFVVPRALARASPDVGLTVQRVLLGLARSSLAASGVLLAIWLVLQSAEIAGASGLRAVLAATGEVAPGTVFGQLVLCQAAGLAAAFAALGRGETRLRRWLAAGFVTLATLLQAGHGHALAMADGPSLLLLSSVLHVLAAGAWLGGLLPLLLVVRVAPARIGAAACRWFSPLGKWCIALLAGSAAIQFWQLIGGLPGLVGTAYGWMALVKLALLAVLLGFAAINRYRFAPALLRATPARARAILLRSIAVQTLVGLMVVVAAALLSSLPPAIHEQPLWPFPVRPSLVALGDPDLSQEAGYGLAGLVAGLALVVLGVAILRRRVAGLAAIAIGLGLGAAAAPHLDLLFVEAYPTSYFHSPTGFAAGSIVQGAVLFPSFCASCHGAGGQGDGPAAKGLAEPPADLTAGHLWAHEDGELFWWLTHGIDGPEGGLVMPGFADRLSIEDRWALIDYIRGRNAGLRFHAAGVWPVPVQAPGFTLSCPDRGEVTTADLRGSVLHIVAMAHPDDPMPAKATRGAITVVMTNGERPAEPATCLVADPAVWAAYALLVGTPARELAGTQVLVDQDGWLRAAQPPGSARWNDPVTLQADIGAIAAHPIAAPGGGHMHH